MSDAPLEPSVASVKKSLEKPLSEEQEKLLLDHVQGSSKCSTSEFMKNLESYPSVFPDSVTTYFMKKQGLETTDPRVVRMISIATQKYISDIISDSMMNAKFKGHTTNPSRPVVLTEELLTPVMKEHGYDIQKPPYHM